MPASQRPWATAQSLGHELAVVGALVFCVVVGLLAITGLGLVTLETMRGYVTGEGLYSKAQKEAIYQLARYAETGDEVFLGRFRTAIALPLAVGEARIALMRSEPDVEAATAALLRARSHPADVPGMVRTSRFASWMPELERAVEIWRESDEGIQEILLIAAEIRAAREAGAAPGRIAELLARLDAMDRRMTALESEFSYTLGEGSRRVRRLAFSGAAASGLLLSVIAVVTAGRWLVRQRRSERLFRSLTEDAHDLLNLIDREGRLRYVSPGVERALGYRPEELQDRSAFELIHPEDHAQVVTAIGRALSNPGEAESAEFRFLHGDGSWRVFESTGRSLPGNGEPLLVVVSRDVTERRELELRLREAHKMESLGRLAGGVAHDFNNLLTAILGSAELLRHELAEGSRARAEVEEIASSGARAARLTGQLLAFARRQPVELRVIDVAALLDGARPLLARLLREEIELVVEAGPGPSTVRASASQLEQVLVNLVVNARDAIAGRGRIVLRTERAGEHVVFSVRDDGTGMSVEVQRRAFEPFFTTKPLGQGTGLGLATCYGIVEQSGGRIVVESALGRGTTVRIELPFVEAEPSKEQEPTLAAAGTRGATVLLVEDEPAVRRIARLALARAGHRVFEAADAPTALRIGVTAGQDLDVLVTDVVIPGMGGRALAAALCERHPRLRVLFVSGYTEDEGLQREVETLSAAFLPKPFTPDSLRARVQELLESVKHAAE